MSNAELIQWLMGWEENVADGFFDLADADDAIQFAQAMRSRLPDLINALRQGGE